MAFRRLRRIASDRCGGRLAVVGRLREGGSFAKRSGLSTREADALRRRPFGAAFFLSWPGKSGSRGSRRNEPERPTPPQLSFPKNKKILKRFDQLADPLRPIEGKRMQKSMTTKNTIKS